MKNVMLVCFVALLVVAALFSAETAKPLPEVTRLHLLAAYQRAIIAQVNAQNAQQAAQNALKGYLEEASKAVEQEKLPKGTTFNINVDTGEVVVVLPAEKPEAKK